MKMSKLFLQTVSSRQEINVMRGCFRLSPEAGDSQYKTVLNSNSLLLYIFAS